MRSRASSAAVCCPPGSSPAPRCSASEACSKQPRRHLLGRQDVVHQTGGNGAPRHAVVGARLGKLSDSHPATLLDGAQAQAAVAAGSRQYDADGALQLILGERGKEGIDRPAELGLRQARPQAQHAPLERERRVGRDDIDVAGRDRSLVVDRVHRHLRVAGQQLAEHARMVRIQVLHVDQGEPRVRRHMFEETLERFQTSGGRADAHNDAPAGPVTRLVKVLVLPLVSRVLHSRPATLTIFTLLYMLSAAKRAKPHARVATWSREQPTA